MIRQMVWKIYVLLIQEFPYLKCTLFKNVQEDVSIKIPTAIHHVENLEAI